MWEKSGSQVMAKNALGHQISVFFSHRYLISGLASDSDFLHVDRHE